MAEEYEPPQCEKCGDEYSLREGGEPTGYCDPCAQEVLIEFQEALEKISEPIPFMRKRAEAAGGKINGRWVVELSNDASFLKSIARAALRKAKA